MPARRGTGIALLADPTRRRIVALLATRPHRSSVVAERMGLSRSATSRQLRLLLDAGLVRATAWLPDGRGVLYSIHPGKHGAITAWLAGTEIAQPVNRLRDDDAPGTWRERPPWPG